MEKFKGGTKQHKKPVTHTGDYKDASKHLTTVENAIQELNREAVRHEHRGLVARQGARDLLEEGRKKEARMLIEQMLSERNYVVACGVTSRRIKRVAEEIKSFSKKKGGLSKRVAKAIGDVETSIKGSILADIEDALNSLESAINPQLEPAASVIELVATVKPTDIDQLQRELEGEIAVLSNLALGKGMSQGGRSRFNARKYKLERELDRGDNPGVVRPSNASKCRHPATDSTTVGETEGTTETYSDDAEEGDSTDDSDDDDDETGQDDDSTDESENTLSGSYENRSSD